MIDMVSRGQVALEFMFFTAIFIVLLTTAFVFSTTMKTDTLSIGRNSEAGSVCRYLSALISAVATSGNGTAVEYQLPLNVEGNNYTVTINRSTASITVDYLTGSQTCPVPTANFTTAVVTNKTGLIKNSGMGVFIG